MYKKIIKEAINQNKLAVFVGSGVSKNSNLPDWGELIEKLKKELNTSETDYLKIAQLYYLAVGETTYLQNIKNYFNVKSKPNNIHKYIFELKPKYIITTNWDTLLEQYDKKNGKQYKIVSSDKDLVSSNIDKMIIKMHGDFNSEKFVFKEDDYINYSKDFPLIENFVKSILSTHTIIFIGYSYSDINLKYIFKWIQNSSKLQPPMFYLTFEGNKHQIRYLENYNIETIAIPEYNKRKDYGYRLERFLKELSDYVLDRDIKQILGEIDLKNSEDIEKLLDFIYEKLKVLENQNYILKDQIIEVLEECSFEFNKKKSFLYFLQNELTYGFNKNSKVLRKIYSKFTEFLLNKEEILACFNKKTQKKIEQKLNKIFDIFLHSNIDGIIVKKERNLFWSYFISGKCSNELFLLLKNLFEDSYELLEEDNSIIQMQYNIFCLYHKREYKKAFILNKELISKCFENDDYINLLFAYFNHNQLVLFLKNNVVYDEEFENDVSETWAYNLEKYDIEEKFFDLPVEIRNQLKTLKKFLTLDFINDLYIKIDDEYQKKKEQEQAIRNKEGFYFDSNVDRFYAYQKELVLFYFQNMLLIDKNFRFRQITKKLCEIELIRGLTFEKIEFDIYQLYAYIHFIDKKSFRELFIRFINDDMYKNKLVLSIELQNWLFKLLMNNYKLFKNTKTPLNFNKNDEVLNIIFLFSITQIDSKVKDKIIKQFIKMIEEYNGNLDLYKSIGEFFKIQYILYKTEVDEENINKFYSMIIEKLLKYFNWQEVNAWFYNAFEYGYFDITFTISEEVYDNEELIEKLITKISTFEYNENLKITLSFLFGLYKISKNQTKRLLKRFLITIYREAQRIDTKLHLYLLYVLDNLFKNNLIELKRLLKKYLEYIENNEYEYEYEYLEAIKHNLQVLIEKEKIKDKEILEMYQKLQNINLNKAMKGHFII